MSCQPKLQPQNQANLCLTGKKKCDFIYIAASPEHKHLHKLFCKLCIENITPGIIGMLFQNCPIFSMILCSKYYTVLLHLEGTW